MFYLNYRSSPRTAYFLNPKYQYREGVGENAALLDAVRNVFNVLFPTSSGAAIFATEVIISNKYFIIFGQYFNIGIISIPF